MILHCTRDWSWFRKRESSQCLISLMRRNLRELSVKSKVLRDFLDSLVCLTRRSRITLSRDENQIITFDTEIFWSVRFSIWIFRKLRQWLTRDRGHKGSYREAEREKERGRIFACVYVTWQHGEANERPRDERKEGRWPAVEESRCVRSIPIVYTYRTWRRRLSWVCPISRAQYPGVYVVCVLSLSLSLFILHLSQPIGRFSLPMVDSFEGTSNLGVH